MTNGNELNYENVERYPGHHIGSKAIFYGQVVQVIQKRKNVELRVIYVL